MSAGYRQRTRVSRTAMRRWWRSAAGAGDPGTGSVLERVNVAAEPRPDGSDTAAGVD